MTVSLIAFDADDTLWHNENLFQMTQERFHDLIADHASPEVLHRALIATERRNLALYGYGVKGFTLSLIETALEVTGGTVPQGVISEILMLGRALIAHPMDVLPGVRETLEALRGRVTLLVITKGDLLHQEQKIAASGLGDLFNGIEIVSEKDRTTYHRIFSRHPGGLPACAMVGNSLKSDILPALEVGAWGLHVPYRLTWEMERVAEVPDHPRLVTLGGIGEVIGWLDRVAAG